MIMNETQIKIRNVIIKAKNLNLKPEEIKGENIIKELGISSVDALEILIGIENEFDITINDEDLSQELVASCDNLEQYINKQKAAHAV
ncbi:MAG: MmcB [uncultured bacterium]|nr:MAG: MmcB [uncultured bacterium]